jgi:hypothetical protein
MNGRCKNSSVPLKDQTYESWALKKDMKYMLKA